MLEPFIRTSALLTKELNEIRRQPRLLLSLILGPFLILMLFGAGFQSSRPELHTVVVFPPEPLPEDLAANVRTVIGTNFEIVAETSDRQQAIQMLVDNRVDVVEVLPRDALARFETGDQATIEVYSNSVNPQIEDWIEYLSFSATNALNNGILRQVVERTQTEARSRHAEVMRLHSELTMINRDLSAARRSELAGHVADVRRSLALLTILAPLITIDADGTVRQPDVSEEIDTTLTALARMERLLADGELAAIQHHVEQARGQLANLAAMLDSYASMPPNVIVSPLQFEHHNVSGQSYELAHYFLPAVLALLVQHIGVALGALALVRERLIGAFEIFRVVPVSITEIILGKSLAYLLMTLLVVAALAALLPLLDMPIAGRLLDIAILVVLLTLAALGSGFLLSTLSVTESQAVQLALLVLLLSIFFGNFFLPLENFWRPVQIIGYMLPLSHGIAGLQDVLLRNQAPDPNSLWALAIVASLTFLVTLLMLYMQSRRRA